MWSSTSAAKPDCSPDPPATPPNSRAHCVWPGCDHPTTRCEVDHLHDYNHGGHTNPTNGAPLCGFRNRWKQKGFSVTRDPDTGRWRTYRPDGSVIE